MFNKIIPSDNMAPITAEQAQDIYGMYKTLECSTKEVSCVFTKQGELGKDYPFVYIEEVSLETQALMDTTYSAMMREDSPTTKSDLETELNSYLLDISTFVSDYIDYMLVYKEGTTWEDFVAQFTYLKEQAYV